MVTQNYNLNLVPGEPPKYAYVSKYDDKSRDIVFSLFSGSKKFTIPESASVTVDGTKKNGEGFSHDCTFSDNKVTVKPSVDMTNIDGDVPCQLTIVDGEETLGTANFILKVERGVLDELSPEQTADAYDILKKAREATENANEAAKNVNETNTKVTEDESARKTAEQGRVTAEQGRVTAESERVTAENARKDAEEKRVQAENTRAQEHSAAMKASETATSAANDAAALATEVAEHPNIPRNGTWWKWDTEADDYVDTHQRAVLGIDKTYDSVEAMEADKGDQPENTVAIIQSNVEDENNAKLYIHNVSDWVYLSDLSGFTGPKGDAATIEVGEVTTGEPGSSVVIKNSGTENAARLDFTIPEGPAGPKGERGDIGPVGPAGGVNSFNGKRGDIEFPVDPTPTESSQNAVQSGGVFTALDKKADKKAPSAAGNVATLDATGNLADGGKKYAPDAKSVSMTSPVGVDANGKLWTDTQSVKRYTVRWDKTTNQMVRLNAAEGIPTDYTHMRYNGAVDPDYSNPFDGIYPWSGIKLCNIDIDVYRKLSAGARVTDCVVAWEGDPDFSYTHANGVWRYHPEFWGRSWEEGSYRYFEITDTALGGFVHYPENIKGRWHGVRVSRSIDGSDKNILLPMANQPCAAEYAVSLMHTEAKNYGATLDSIYTIDADFLLYLVEFANTNAQTVLGNGVASLYQADSKHPVADATNSTTVTVLTADAGIIIPGALFTIGDTNDRGLVNRAVVKSTAASGANTVVTLDRAVTITTAQFWNIHGLANMADEAIGSRSGYIGVNGKSIAYYRGLEMYGNMFFYVLGAYRAQTTDNVWIAHSIEEADGYDALNTAVHKDTGVKLASNPAGTDVAWAGYVKTLGLCSGLSVPPFCTEAGGNATRPVGDHLWMPTHATVNTILLLGGHAYNGLACGPASAYWRNASSIAWWDSSARPSLKNPH